MDGFIYVYETPRSSAQMKYTERRIQEQRNRRAQEASVLKYSKEDNFRIFHENDSSNQHSDYIDGDKVAAASAITRSNTTVHSDGATKTKPAPALHLERVASSEQTTLPPRQSRKTASSSLGDVKASTQSSSGGKMDGQSTISMTSLASTLNDLSSSSSLLAPSHADLLSNPFELRHGRRYLRELPYPLPVDLPELHRQNLRTLIGCSVFGRPICSPVPTKCPPRRVLELGCGSGYWSAKCHEYFCTLGHRDVEFVGLDIAPLAPDFQKQGNGMNWTFVQHDLCRLPLPFDDGEFDLIMLKDLSLTLPFTGTRSPFEMILDECVRLLRAGGVLEIWDSEHLTRCILPHPPPVAGQHRKSQELALRTGTFLIAPGTPFAPAQNKYLDKASVWIKEAIDLKKLPTTPCARIAQMLYQEPERLGEIDYRRIAIPLGEQRWERDDPRQQQQTRGGSRGRCADPHDSFMSTTSVDGRQKPGTSTLTSDQLALRQTALLTVVQFIESMEPLLQEVSGKNAEEWAHWWSAMVGNLMDPEKEGAINGECLEVGAWWCIKIAAT